jgi:hypothetical protein
MSYKEQLNPWVVHQLAPDLTRSPVSRFRRRTEAEAYLKVMKQLRPKTDFSIVFETNNGSAVSI